MTTRCDTVLLAMSEVDCVAQQISRFCIELASIYRLPVIESIYKCPQRFSAANNGPNYQLLIVEPSQNVLPALTRTLTQCGGFIYY